MNTLSSLSQSIQKEGKLLWQLCFICSNELLPNFDISIFLGLVQENFA